MYTEAYKKLERSLTDNITEAQAKLGYSKNTMQFYYPLRTLNHFFNSEWKSDKMNKALQELLILLPLDLEKLELSIKNIVSAFI